MVIYLLVIALVGNSAGSFERVVGRYATIAECEAARESIVRAAVVETRVETLVSGCMTGKDVISLHSYGGPASTSARESM